MIFTFRRNPNPPLTKQCRCLVLHKSRQKCHYTACQGNSLSCYSFGSFLPCSLFACLQQHTGLYSQTAQPEQGVTTSYFCSGNAKSQPEKVMGHLVRRQGQPQGAQVQALHLSDWKGRSQDLPLPRPHLKVSSGGKGSSCWRSLLT